MKLVHSDHLWAIYSSGLYREVVSLQRSKLVKRAFTGGTKERSPNDEKEISTYRLKFELLYPDTSP